MIDNQHINLNKFFFNTIFIIEDRNYWNAFKGSCDKNADLVLCVDFALKKDLQEKGYNVEFLDHLVKSSFINEINLKTNSFLYNWYKDDEGNDLLTYEGIDLGYSLLLNLTNDVTYFSRFFFNLYALKSIEYKNLIIATHDDVIIDVCNKICLEYKLQSITILTKSEVYLFPISKWIDEAISNVSWKQRLKKIINTTLDLRMIFLDFFKTESRKNIYFQVYYPTVSIIKQLMFDKKIKIILDDYQFNNKDINLLKQRRLTKSYQKVTSKEKEGVLKNYKKGIKFKWKFEEHDITQYLAVIVDKIIQINIDDMIAKAKNIKNVFRNKPLDLMIPVTDLWIENKLLMNYCKINDIPVFFIMNGLLNNAFSMEGKDSLLVNCYSKTCKEDFFLNADNVYALGDPRMDKYANVTAKHIDREKPTIIIGAAGFDVTDINSYLAFEFDFLFDILQTIDNFKKEGFQSEVILKVRGNGYSHLYTSFVNEYFPDLNVKVIRDTPFYEVIQKADLYISIYSQTLFEASCLGIPVIYYKKDTQELFRPFDNRSELITAVDVETLTEKFKLFYSNSQDYSLFMQKEILEKYIGSLNGENLKNNIDFIYKRLSIN